MFRESKATYLAVAKMPRLYHNKSSNGCVRCKRRKVKCDEVRPVCGACARHNVPCEYRTTAIASSGPSAAESPEAPRSSSIQSQTSEIQQPSASSSASTLLPSTSRGSNVSVTNALELRLLHYFLAYTRYSFAGSTNFWAVRGPLISYEHRSVFDGLLAVAALHLHRQSEENTTTGTLAIDPQLQQTSNVQRPSLIVTPASSSTSPTTFAAGVAITEASSTDHDMFLAGRTSKEMRQISLHYFHRAIQGHRENLENLERRAYEAAYTASALIVNIALFLLSGTNDEDDENGLHFPLDESLWFRLAVGPREIVHEWRAAEGGADVMAERGIYQGEPDFSDSEELFRPSHAEPLKMLATWGSEYEYIPAADQEAYDKTLAYVGLLYKHIFTHSEAPIISCRRILALPARLPARYLSMVLQQQPRALTILAYVFTMAKMLEADIIWFRGIAERQVPSLYERLPAGWKRLLDWPMAVVDGDVRRAEELRPKFSWEEGMDLST